MNYSVELFIDGKFAAKCSYGKDLAAAYKTFQMYRLINPESVLKLIGREEQIIQTKAYNEDLQDNQTN